VSTELGPPTAKVEHEVGPGMHGRKLLDRHVPPDTQHGKFSVLVEQGIVAENREIDLRTQLTRIERISSPWRIALTTSIPSVT
jgi:hypothetical protein